MCSGRLVGFAREMPMHEPPRKWMRLVSAIVRGATCETSPVMSHWKPSCTPRTSTPESAARMVAAPMTLLMPGAGPPATTMASLLLGRTMSALGRESVTAWWSRRSVAIVAKEELMKAATEILKRAPGAPVSVVLGAMNFGKRTSVAESERIVRRALERGVTVFDTANSYNGGRVGAHPGSGARARPRARHALDEGGSRRRNPAGPRGSRPAAMRGALEASLERLGTDYVDIYYLHVPDRKTPIEQTLDGVAELMASGRVRAWGASNYASWELLEMRVDRVRARVSRRRSPRSSSTTCCIASSTSSTSRSRAATRSTR